MNEFTLKDAIAVLDEDSNAAQDPRLVEYVSRALDVGRKILIKLSDDEQMAAVSLLQATVMADRLAERDLSSALFLMENIEESGLMLAIALRIAVGMAVMEEWH